MQTFFEYFLIVNAWVFFILGCVSLNVMCFVMFILIIVLYCFYQINDGNPLQCEICDETVSPDNPLRKYEQDDMFGSYMCCQKCYNDMVKQYKKYEDQLKTIRELRRAIEKWGRKLEELKDKEN